MLKIKIVGAGSAGNHIAYAFKKYKSQITMQDINETSLKRSKNEIYLSRYKKWDKNIKLITNDNSKYKYDCVIISSPPNTHLKILKKNLKQSDIFLIEKPICEPNKKTINELKKIFLKNKSKIFLSGYNHRLFPSTQKFKKILAGNNNKFNYLNVNFKEDTSGFLKAHSWYKDLSESYLSKQNKGGGSLCEHSHALNLAQYLVGDKKNFELNFKKIRYYKDKKNNYDKDANIIFNENKKIIEINQNFETYPTEKNILITSNNFYLKLIYNYKKNNDYIIYINKNDKIKKEFIFRKKRSDDFQYEADYLYKIIKSKNNKITKKLASVLDAKFAIKTIEKIYNLIHMS